MPQPNNMKELKFTVMGFLIAPMIPAIALAVLTPVTGGLINTDLLSVIGLSLILYIFCMAAALFLGLPSFLFLRSYNAIRWWSAGGLGFCIGAVVEIVVRLPQLVWDFRAIAIFGSLGLLTGLVFWFIWKQGDPVAWPAPPSIELEQ